MTSHSIKCVAVGDGAVGLTALVIRQTEARFFDEYAPTVFDTYAIPMKYQNKDIEFQFWDTAGQEEYDRLRPLSYPQTDNIKVRWIPEIKHHCPEAPIILVATKCDLRSDVEIRAKLKSLNLCPITVQQGLKLAKELNLEYVECSAYTGTNVNLVFLKAIRAVLNKRNEKINNKFKNVNDLSWICNDCNFENENTGIFICQNCCYDKYQQQLLWFSQRNIDANNGNLIKVWHLYKENKFNESLILLNRYYEIGDFKNGLLFYLMAIIEYKLCRFNDSIMSFKCAVKMNNKNGLFYIRLIYSLLLQLRNNNNILEDCQYYMKQYLKIASKNEFYMYFYNALNGCLLLKQNKIVDAKLCFDKSINSKDKISLNSIKNDKSVNDCILLENNFNILNILNIIKHLKNNLINPKQNQIKLNDFKYLNELEQKINDKNPKSNENEMKNDVSNVSQLKVSKGNENNQQKVDFRGSNNSQVIITDGKENEMKNRISSQQKFEYWLVNTVKLEEYLGNFKSKQCNKMELIDYFDNDSLLNTFNIKNSMHRELIIKQCIEYKKLKTEFIIWLKSNNLRMYYPLFIGYNIFTLNDLNNALKNIKNNKWITDKILNENLRTIKSYFDKKYKR